MDNGYALGSIPQTGYSSSTVAHALSVDSPHWEMSSTTVCPILLAVMADSPGVFGEHVNGSSLPFIAILISSDICRA